jgi:hypothetical protein
MYINIYLYIYIYIYLYIYISDTQSELHKMTRAHEDLQQQSSSSITVKEQSKALKDHESRLFQTENTLRLLEETLQEKEVN